MCFKFMLKETIYNDDVKPFQMQFSESLGLVFQTTKSSTWQPFLS